MFSKENLNQLETNIIYSKKNKIFSLILLENTVPCYVITFKL